MTGRSVSGSRSKTPVDEKGVQRKRIPFLVIALSIGNSEFPGIDIMKVAKFGGSSLADGEKIAKVCDIIVADDDRRIVVVSAPGKRDAQDIKITDHLITCGENALAGTDDGGALDAIIERFASIQRELALPSELLETIAENVRSRVEADRTHPDRYLDALKAAGEDNCARLVAAELQKRGCPGNYMNPGDAGMLVSAEFGQARLLAESYDNLSSLGESTGITIFPGFFGYSPDGDVVTFSRGGSDITGAILAAAVKAEVYENFTDVDSVFAVDPRIVPDARPIAELTYREMRELAYAGFSVLHDEAIAPAMKAGIPIQIRNTHCLEAPGTTILPEHTPGQTRVTGIASAPGFCTIYVSKYLMNREIGFGRRLLQILEEEKISFQHSPSGIDNLSIVLSQAEMSMEKESRVIGRIRNELKADKVEVERGLALIMVVGEGMHYSVGVAARATSAFSESDVNIEMINQGSSEISMMFGVREEDRERAIQTLYRAFFDDVENSAL